MLRVFSDVQIRATLTSLLKLIKVQQMMHDNPGNNEYNKNVKEAVMEYLCFLRKKNQMFSELIKGIIILGCSINQLRIEHYLIRFILF